MSIQSLNHLLSKRAREEPGRSFLASRHSLSLIPATTPDTFILGVPEKAITMVEHTFGELSLSASLLARHYASVLPSRARGDFASQLTVALLAPSNYHCTRIYVSSAIDLCSLAFRRRRERDGAVPHGSRNAL